MNNRFYEKVEKLCQRIDSYTEKDTSVKNEVKTTLYITKINKLISMIENAENNTYIPQQIIDVRDRISNDSNNNKYDPYNENFYYKDKLEQLNGDIEELIIQLKAEDEVGYRNAYIISEIEKCIKNKKESVKIVNISNRGKRNENLPIKEKLSFWEKIKNIFRFKK